MDDPVSRETPPTPEVATGVFSHRLPVVQAFAELLATVGTERGLIGPREVPRLWDRHLLNCGVLTDLVGPDATVCDLGSGAGLPGIVMAARRPDLVVTVVEPLLRRTTFLHEAVQGLGLTNVEVVRGRAEQLHGTRTFDVVTARALAPLDRLALWSMPLVRRDGHLLAMKGETAADELRVAAAVLADLGGTEPEVVTVAANSLLFPTTVVRVRAGAVPPLRLSRAGSRSRHGSAGKRKKRGEH